MNPFLVGSCIGCWAIFTVSMLLAYLSRKDSDAPVVAFIFFFLAVFLTIAAGAEWDKVNHPVPAQVEKVK